MRVSQPQRQRRTSILSSSARSPHARACAERKNPALSSHHLTHAPAQRGRTRPPPPPLPAPPPSSPRAAGRTWPPGNGGEGEAVSAAAVARTAVAGVAAWAGCGADLQAYQATAGLPHWPCSSPPPLQCLPTSCGTVPLKVAHCPWLMPGRTMTGKDAARGGGPARSCWCQYACIRWGGVAVYGRRREGTFSCQQLRDASNAAPPPPPPSPTHLCKASHAAQAVELACHRERRHSVGSHAVSRGAYGSLRRGRGGESRGGERGRAEGGAACQPPLPPPLPTWR